MFMIGQSTTDYSKAVGVAGPGNRFVQVKKMIILK